MIQALPKTWVIKVQQQSLRGDPDLVIVCNGAAVFMELKKDSKSKADKLQRWKLEQAAKAGAFAMVVSPELWGDAYRFLYELAHGHRDLQHLLELPECLRLPSTT